MDDTARLLPNPQPRATREHADQEYRLRHTRLVPLATRCLVRGWTTKTSSKRGIDFKLSRCGGQIFKCLPCRGKLSPGTRDHGTNKIIIIWCNTLHGVGLDCCNRHPRLAYLSIDKSWRICVLIIHPPNRQEPAITLHSAHYSTLIGLLCAFKLERPVERTLLDDGTLGRDNVDPGLGHWPQNQRSL